MMILLEEPNLDFAALHQGQVEYHGLGIFSL